METQVYYRQDGRMHDLGDIMEFDAVIQINGDRTASRRLDIHAPELCDGELSALSGRPWRLMTGHSGQHGYSGPLMHQSEVIGGGMADYILDRPGLYVALVDYTIDGDASDCWAVAYCEAPDSW